MIIELHCSFCGDLKISYEEITQHPYQDITDFICPNPACGRKLTLLKASAKSQKPTGKRLCDHCHSWLPYWPTGMITTEEDGPYPRTVEIFHDDTLIHSCSGGEKTGGATHDLIRGKWVLDLA